MMWKNVLLAIASALVALAALEAGIRLADLQVNEFLHGVRVFGMFVEWDEEGQYHRGVPGARFMANDVEYAFNALGVRGVVPPETKPPGTIRVVTLGDSVTGGSGVPVSATYPALLGTALASRGVQVVPAAFGGWDTVQEYNFLRHNLDRLDPDVVTLLYVSNDADRLDPWKAVTHPSATMGARIHRTLVVHSRLVEWASWLYTTRLKPTDWAGLRDMRDRAKEEQAAGAKFAPSHPGWIASRQALEEILDLTRSHGAALVLFAWNLGNYDPDPRMVERLRQFGAEHRVPVFDTARVYADAPASDFWVLPFVDIHPNARAHRRLADFVLATLDDLGLLDPR